MRDCLLLVDLFNDFQHDDGDLLLASLRDRFPGVRDLISACRATGMPTVYANDSSGVFDGDAHRIVELARRGPAGSLIDSLRPQPRDSFVVKPRYSAFDSTPLALILQELQTERVILAGMSTEGCVAQTAIAARELGLKVTVITSACCTVDPELEGIALAYLERVAGVQLAASAARSLVVTS